MFNRLNLSIKELILTWTALETINRLNNNSPNPIKDKLFDDSKELMEKIDKHLLKNGTDMSNLSKETYEKLHNREN